MRNSVAVETLSKVDAAHSVAICVNTLRHVCRHVIHRKAPIQSPLQHNRSDVDLRWSGGCVVLWRAAVRWPGPGEAEREGVVESSVVESSHGAVTERCQQLAYQWTTLRVSGL